MWKRLLHTGSFTRQVDANTELLRTAVPLSRLSPFPFSGPYQSLAQQISSLERMEKLKQNDVEGTLGSQWIGGHPFL
jgi:hypothetical protein